MGGVHWNGEGWLANELTPGLQKNLKAASIFLSGVIKADISQPGTLRYTRTKKNGQAAKRQSTIYNFSHSLPGNPPFKQSGHLRRSIAWEVLGLIGRVGSNLVYARALELKMNRPYLAANLWKHASTLRAILTRTIQPGALGSIRAAANQFRSGVLGRGAAQAGYDRT